MLLAPQKHLDHDVAVGVVSSGECRVAFKRLVMLLPFPAPPVIRQVGKVIDQGIHTIGVLRPDFLDGVKAANLQGRDHRPQLTVRAA